MLPNLPPGPINRREMLRNLGGGFGTLGLAGALAGGGYLTAASRATDPMAPRPTHFKPRAKRVIFLFMNGGPSHVDPSDPKPMLATRNGQDPPEVGRMRKGRKLMQSPFHFVRHGQSGIEVSE